MDALAVTFTNGLGEALAPVLLWVRDRGFFEWYVFMPIMTAASIGLFVKIRAKLESNGTFSKPRTKSTGNASPLKVHTEFPRVKLTYMWGYSF